MAKQNDQRELPNFQKYQYAALAERLRESDDGQNYVAGALENLVGSKGMNLDEDGRIAWGAMQDAYSHGEKMALDTSAKLYAGKFEKNRGEYKPAELVSWYEKALSGLDDETKGKIIGKLGEFDETLGSIRKKLAKAQHDAQGMQKGIEYTKEQKEATEKTLKKYSGVYGLIQALDRYTFENLRPEVVNSTRKNELKDLASKL